MSMRLIVIGPRVSAIEFWAQNHHIPRRAIHPISTGARYDQLRGIPQRTPHVRLDDAYADTPQHVIHEIIYSLEEIGSPDLTAHIDWIMVWVRSWQSP